MADQDPERSDQLDQLFAAPEVAPVAAIPPLGVAPVGPIMLAEGDAGRPLATPQQVHAQAIGRFQWLLSKLTPVVWVTPALVLMNVAMYVLMVARGVDPLQPNVMELLAWGANYAPLTWKNEPWRLVSNMFIHCGILHLAFNMWALWNAGRLLERLVGNVGFLIIYFASGLAGSIASLWWNGDVVSVGASGAIFGLLGAFATFIWNRSDTFPMQALSQLRNSLATCIGFNLLFGASIQGIDQAAHVGGLVCGLICGWLLNQPLDQGTAQRRIQKNLITAVAAAISLGILILQPHHPPPDLFQELAIYDQIVPATLKKFDAIAHQFNSKELTPKQFIEVVRTEILPPWKQVREHVDSLKNIPAGRRELLHQIRDHLALREESWTLLIQALETSDTEKFMEYKAKWEQADGLSKQLGSS